MIAVIFEVTPGAEDAYLDHAARLAPLLDAHPGFISVERFRSLADPAWLLSLSFFEDEAAVRAWRARPEHRATQAAGRAGVLADYRLRVADVARDYGMTDRAQCPLDSRAVHEGPAPPAPTGGAPTAW
ncbi:antibiotic biosynthesis monooxygenase family protein [Jannaschia ovalis]|uniref:Antibiotic biosynthesis monooxygenase n=1 Tax=Jannaschia ovalis TaxID=3038773 RepID=A0ABY8LCM6_9RHOB|nr:antibiotic biosynthesis monooxygenase [Jannaschia sp. GRR-S6-38]WGH79074.1 antibiotic biosynthesis monooxygenase [Jannaschia sp. GRR-S6-38]